MIDFTVKAKQKEVKIKVSKGKLKNKKMPDFTPSPPAEDFLNQVQFQFVETRVSANPPESPTILSPSEKTLPYFVSHAVECTCPICSDLMLSLLCTRWMVVKAENGHQSKDLLRLALQRSQSSTKYFSGILKEIVQAKDHRSVSLGINDGLIAQIYQSLIYMSPPPNLPEGILDEGLDFVSSRPASFPKEWKASLLLAKALDTVYNLATKHGGCIADLFTQVWGWKPNMGKKVLDSSSKSSSISRATSNKKKGSQKLSVPIVQDLVFSPDESEPNLPSVSIKTPTQSRKDCLTTQTKSVVSTVFKKSSVSVYNDESPKPEVAPRAPRRPKTRTVIKVST